MSCFLIKIRVKSVFHEFLVYAVDDDAAAICAQVHLQAKYDVEIY